MENTIADLEQRLTKAEENATIAKQEAELCKEVLNKLLLEFDKTVLGTFPYFIKVRKHSLVTKSLNTSHYNISLC